MLLFRVHDEPFATLRSWKVIVLGPGIVFELFPNIFTDIVLLVALNVTVPLFVIPPPWRFNQHSAVEADAAATWKVAPLSIVTPPVRLTTPVVVLPILFTFVSLIPTVKVQFALTVTDDTAMV